MITLREIEKLRLELMDEYKTAYGVGINFDLSTPDGQLLICLLEQKVQFTILKKMIAKKATSSANALDD